MKSRSLPTRSEPSVSSPATAGKLVMTILLALMCREVAGQPRGQNDVARPKITGIAHVRLYSANLDASREFYQKIVGLSSGVAGCLGIARPCFAVNSRQ